MAVGGWVCPNCERRVPAYITVCRCGFSQERSEPGPPAAPTRPAGAGKAARGSAATPRRAPTASERAAQQGAAIRRAVRSAPSRSRAGMVTHARPSALAWDFWVAIVFMALLAMLAIWRLSQPAEPIPFLPLLGTMEPERPTPTPPPTPEPKRR